MILMIMKTYLSLELLNTIINSIQTVLLIWGYIQFWHKFNRQKRIENLTAIAKETLFYLPEVEELIKRLFFLSKDTIKNVHKNNNNEHTEVQSNLSFALNKLRSFILLINKDADLVANTKISELASWIEKLNRILNQHQAYPSSFISIDLLSEVGLLGKDTYSTFSTIEDLRKLLVSIHQIDI